MTANYGYNPCEHGLCAKVWECLRRNEAFRRDIEKLRGAAPEERKTLGAQVANRLSKENKIGSVAVEWFASSDPGFDQDTPWPKTPNWFQGDFAFECKRMVGFPVRVTPPPFDEITAAISSRGSEGIAGISLWYWNARNTWESFDVIAVPKFIRDKKHKKEVEKALCALVTVTDRDTRKFLNDGSVLGTRVEWDVYLFVKRQIASGVSNLTARREAALHFYGKRVAASRPHLKAAAFSKMADGVHTKQSTHIDNRIAAIEDAIASVYPVFKPLFDSA